MGGAVIGLPACGAGTVTNIPNNGTGGNTVTIAHADGYKSQYLHLSAFVLANGTSVARGATVGRSGGAVGAPGSGSSTGPHLHWHMINPSGTRINPLEYVAAHPPTGALPKTTTETTGEPGPACYRRMQNWLRLTNGYTGPIDGVMGTISWRGFARFLNLDAWD
ncbi:M23 family metallopeptidase [Dactylosporangium cerinum]|uniref:M23 family metallopeptidase n=1 Tax=Dactylosporangium cerinum TaxID=1434730 RepID=A0ABV9VMM6_9ACTN